MAALARNDVGGGELSSQLREEVLRLHLLLLPSCQHQPLQPVPMLSHFMSHFCTA